MRGSSAWLSRHTGCDWVIQIVVWGLESDNLLRLLERPVATEMRAPLDPGICKLFRAGLQNIASAIAVGITEATIAE